MTDAALAADLAADAGELLLKVRDEFGFGHPWALGDAGDSLANDSLLRRLRAERPSDAVLSEEAYDDLVRLESDRVWIIDPLDGTREFSTPGRDDWAVHIALWQRPDRRPSARSPTRRWLCPRAGTSCTAATPSPTAPRGVGIPATIRIAVSATRPPAVLHRMRQTLAIQPVAIGSAGAKAMAVIDGDVDAYVHAGGQWEWDSAAPAGVVMAAGMHASRLDGSPLRYNQLDPYLPDFVMCRAELAPILLGAIRAGKFADARARLKSTICSRGPPHRFRRCRDAARTCGCTTPPTGRCARWRPGRPATMYVCGITPYDATHLGHAATYLAFDLVHRQWLDLGHDVHYVQNVTDVDDPLFERADRDGVDWRELGDREVALFREDMAALRVLPPTRVRRGHRGDCRGGRARRKDAGLRGGVRRRRANTPTSTTGPMPRRSSATSRAMTATPCCGCSPSAAATRTGPARPTNSTRCCGGPRGPGSPAGRRRSAPAGPAGTSNARRSRSAVSAAAWTFRAGAAT